MTDATSPLSPVIYQVLVSLGDGEKHGYAIMQEVAERTQGRVRLLPGTLYSTLKKMLSQELVERCEPPSEAASLDERRRFYRLTPRGRRLAVAETDRLAMLVSLARDKGLVSEK